MEEATRPCDAVMERMSVCATKQPIEQPKKAASALHATPQNSTDCAPGDQNRHCCGWIIFTKVGCSYGKGFMFGKKGLRWHHSTASSQPNSDTEEQTSSARARGEKSRVCFGKSTNLCATCIISRLKVFRVLTRATLFGGIFSAPVQLDCNQFTFLLIIQDKFKV